MWLSPCRDWTLRRQYCRDRRADHDTEILHRTSNEFAEKLIEEDLTVGMQITGDWPY